MLKIELRGDPTAQARARMFTRHGKSMCYDPQGALKQALKMDVMDQIPQSWEKPKYPRLMFWFYMPIPKSMAKSDREKTQHEILKHVKKPDVDNLMKLYMDVLTGIVYDDDNCVSIGSAVKVYSAMPRVVIYIEETGSTVTQNEVWEGTWPTQNNGEF